MINKRLLLAIVLYLVTCCLAGYSYRRMAKSHLGRMFNIWPSTLNITYTPDTPYRHHLPTTHTQLTDGRLRFFVVSCSVIRKKYIIEWCGISRLNETTRKQRKSRTLAFQINRKEAKNTAATNTLYILYIVLLIDFIITKGNGCTRRN